jgi:hypothetical protein
MLYAISSSVRRTPVEFTRGISAHTIALHAVWQAVLCPTLHMLVLTSQADPQLPQRSFYAVDMTRASPRWWMWSGAGERDAKIQLVDESVLGVRLSGGGLGGRILHDDDS